MKASLRQFFLILLVIVSFSLNAEILISSREGDPDAFVENVNVIHGDYSELEVDLNVSGADQLLLTRYYSSQNQEIPTNFGGWFLRPQRAFKVDQENGDSYSTHEGEFKLTHVYVGTEEGSILKFTGWQNNENASVVSTFQIDAEEEFLGTANTARGKPSAWTNIKNYKLIFYPDRNIYEVLFSDGRKHIFSYNQKIQGYQLQREELPSGNVILSEYDEQNRLIKLKMMTEDEEQVISWISLEYEETVKVISSEDHYVTYQFTLNSLDHSLLSQVFSTEGINVFYEYQSNRDLPLLTKKFTPQGRSLSIKYESGIDHRVINLSYPLGSDQEASTFFEYHRSTDESGYTQVIDPLGGKKCYYFDADYQLTAIEYYLSGALYRRERKTWGENTQIGNLKASSIEDALGNVFYHKTYDYDAENNLIEEKEYGNFTGNSSEPITFDYRNIPSGECHSTKYEYSSEKNINIVFQGDDRGSGIKCGYKKGTNIPLFKFVLEKKKILKRTFYEYKHGALTELTVDDGSHPEKGKMSGWGVSERHITRITPRSLSPNWGAPEIIEELCWSFKGQKEALTKKTMNHFDSKGQVISQKVYGVGDNFCYELNKEYDSKGQLISETDPMGNLTKYIYDELGNLISEQNNQKKLTYTYDVLGNLVSFVELGSNGHAYETKYEYDVIGNKICETDFIGRKISYSYDELGRLRSVVHPKQFVFGSKMILPIFTYEYDFFDHQIAIIHPNGAKVQYFYNIQGKPTKIVHLDGKEELYEYSVSGSLSKYQESNGNIKKYSYDPQGRVQGVEHFHTGQIGSYRRDRYTYRGFHLTSKEDSNGRETFEYDAMGRLSKSVVETENSSSQSYCKNVTEFLYDCLGRLQGTKKWKNKTEFTLYLQDFDFLDRLTGETIEDEHGQILSQTKYEYDASGQLSRVIGYPNNQQSVLANYKYDDFGRLLQIKDALGSIRSIEYDDYYVDSMGQKSLLKKTTDAKGHQTEEVFDAMGNLTHVLKKDCLGNLITEENYFYDLFGNRVHEKAKGEKDYSNSYSFLAGRELEKVIIGSESTQQSFIQDIYNYFGQIIEKRISGFDKPINYSYQGWLEEIRYHDHLGERLYAFRWDKSGNPKEIKIDRNQKIESSFNSVNALLKEAFHDSYGSYFVSFEYDGSGNITKISLPDSSHILYDYQGPFIDTISRLSSNGQELYTHSILERDLTGSITKEILIGNVGIQEFSYDLSGRKTQIITDFFEDEILSYDENGNILHRTLNNKQSDLAYDYQYDALDQLVSEEGLGFSQYEYDTLGNRTAEDGLEWKVNELNQVCSSIESKFIYDEAGNLTTSICLGVNVQYFYDQLGRLIEVKPEGRFTIKYTYDPFGRRLTKVIEDDQNKIEVYRYFYLGFYELGCVDKNGKIIQLRIPNNPNSLEESSIVAIEIEDRSYAAITDLGGNISCLINPQRRKVFENYLYTAYGNESIYNSKGKQISREGAKNPWRYQGKYHDPETGFVYFGQRYYSPEIGKWISPDPALSVDSLNLYIYAHNNPLRYKDFLGLSAQECGCQIHGHPGYYVRPDGCICICGKNGAIKSTFCGIAHGLFDIGYDILQDIDTVAFYGELYSVRLFSSSQEKRKRIHAFERSQQLRYSKVESWIHDALGINANDPNYASYRSSSKMGIEMGLMVAGGYGIYKSVSLGSRATKAIRVSKSIVKNIQATNRGIEVGRFKYSKTAFKHYNEYVKRGAHAGRLNRPFMRSPLTIEEIMSAKRPIPDPRGLKGGLRWEVPGSFRGKEGIWELVVHPENNTIYHFNFQP